jgi:TIR domain-containing protein
LDIVPRLLLGRDVFLSYSHRDGIPYARKLARDLETKDRRRRLTCYFDQRSAIIDSRLPAEVDRSLRWSSMLVVVATPGAARSAHVRTEISSFEQTRRPVVLLVCQTANQPDEHLRQFTDDLSKKSAVIVDEPSNVVSAGPTEAALERVRDSVDFVRQNRRLAISGLTALVVVACISLFAAWRARRDDWVLAQTKYSALTPGIVVHERTTVLDLAGWAPTTSAELAARVKKSKAISANHFTVRKTKADATTFVHIMGTSSGIMPEVHNLSSLPLSVEPRRHDETTRAPNEWTIKFDISQIPVGKKIDIDFAVDFWNAFQTPNQWWGGFRILHQTGLSTYAIMFPPARRPLPETLSYAVKEDNENERKFDDETPDSAVELDENHRVSTVTWRKQSPLGDTSYRIKWDWNR